MDTHRPYQSDNFNGAASDWHRQLQQELDDEDWDWAYRFNHRPWWEKKSLEALYDGSIHRVDSQLRRLIEDLKKKGDFDNTLIVITGDHGEAFGEKSNVHQATRLAGHRVGLHEVQVHVPLIVSFPQQSEPQKISTPATLTRFPTAVEQAITQNWNGDEFVPDDFVITTSIVEKDPRVTNADGRTPQSYSENIHAVYNEEEGDVKKYILSETDSAIVSVINPQSTVHIESGRDKVVNKRLESLNDEQVRIDQEDVDRSTRRQLAELGYL